jgi:hypothetical protein
MPPSKSSVQNVENAAQEKNLGSLTAFLFGGTD